MRTSETAPEVRALADLFLAAPVGGVVKFEDMEKALGRGLNSFRHLIPRARVVASKEAGALFESVRTLGYRRLPASDAHRLGQHARRRIRRTARKAAGQIVSAVVKANDMPADAARAAYREVSVLNLISHLSQEKAMPEPPKDAKPEPLAITARKMLERMGAITPEVGIPPASSKKH